MATCGLAMREFCVIGAAMRPDTCSKTVSDPIILGTMGNVTAPWSVVSENSNCGRDGASTRAGYIRVTIIFPF